MNVRISLVAVLALCFASLAAAQTAPKVKSLTPPPHTLLLVGNSFFYFNDSMHRYLGGMVAEGLPELRGKYRATSVTISGSGLNWHDMEAYLKPGSGMASYSFAPGNKVVFNKFDRATMDGPAVMLDLEKRYGKQITTRTWNTVLKIVAKMQQIA